MLVEVRQEGRGNRATREQFLLFGGPEDSGLILSDWKVNSSVSGDHD